MNENIYETNHSNELEMVEVIDRYLDMFNQWENLRDTEENKSDEILGANYFDIKRVIDEKLVPLVEKIHDIIRENNKLIISRDNSFRDIFNNSTLVGVNFMKKSIKEKAEGGERERKQAAKLIQTNFPLVEKYLKELCDDEKKLVKELSERDGYLGKYKKFFKREGLGGSRKIPFFLFFCRLERGEIDEKNFDEEVVGLESGFLNEKLLKEEMNFRK